MSDSDRRMLAERIRQACIKAAKAGYEDAAMSGLCAEGAMEVAISSMEKLELDEIVNQSAANG